MNPDTRAIGCSAMGGFRLLKIMTQFLLLEINGPIRSRWSSIDSANDPTSAFLAIESSAGTVEVNWTDTEGINRTWVDGGSGPRFFEETAYRLRVKSLVPGHIPVITNRDPTLLSQLDTYHDDLTCSGSVNFRRQIGRSDLEVTVANDTLRFTIEVFPAKLDYERDYGTLLREVALAARGLALEYLRATYRRGTALEEEQTTNLEWITLLRNEINTLEAALLFISAHPNRSLQRDVEDVRVDKIKRSDSSVRRAVLRNHGRGQWIQLPNVGQVRNVIPATRNRETLDTPEHRWLRLNLALIHEKIADLHASVLSEVRNYDGAMRPIPKRLQAEERELAKFLLTVKRFLALHIFDGAVQPPPSGFTSLALLGTAGYRDAYRSILILRLGLSIDGDRIGLSVMDIHELYEVWCFIELVVLISSIVGGKSELGDLIQIEETGIRIRLRRGERSSVSRVTALRTIVMSYNPSFTGLTGDQKPDIVLRFEQDGWPHLIVVFDAKYRLDSSIEYANRFGTYGPPPDAINALHRYRDAIVVESVARGLERPVVKGVALFPLSVEASNEFGSSSLFSALEILGIGALPFLPANTSFVTAWLESLLALTPELLAEPGVPFAGLRELQRRRVSAEIIEKNNRSNLAE